MSKFALIKMDEVVGKIIFFKLVIDEDCPFNRFESNIETEGNLKKQLPGLYAIMDQVANLQRLPSTKFRDITPVGDRVKEYEIKKGDLRIYLIKKEGHIIVIAGKKNTQSQDIKTFRNIKRRYLESKP